MARRPLTMRAASFLLERLPVAFGLAPFREPERTALADAMAALGVPVVEAGSAEEEARLLIEAAAEIEHALLIEYLYAAISLTSGTLRSACKEVAIQEMAHLVTVQNLLLFLGCLPYFERQDSSPNPDLDPFPFTLTGAHRLETLERFVLAEMPETPPEEDRDRITEIQNRLDPRRKFRRVGIVYARIYWLLQSGSSPEGPWPEAAEFAKLHNLGDWHIAALPHAGSAATLQASRDEIGPRGTEEGEIWWQDYGLDGVFRTIATRADALAAVHDIAVQGEGLAGSGPDSHFVRFLKELKAGPPPSTALIPVPDDPSLDQTAGRTQITDPLAVALCRLLDNRYRIMITALAAALRYRRDDPAQNRRRQTLAGWAFFEMRMSIRALAGNIVRRPCLAGGSAKSLAAAPIFDLGRLPLPSDVAAIERLLEQLHHDTAPLVAEIRVLGMTAGILNLIEQANQQRFP